MAKMVVDVAGNWAGVDRFFMRTPTEVINAVKNVLKQPMKQASDRMKQNVSGAILKRNTGKLASTITSSVRSTRTKVTGRAGTKWYIARFWEDGFNHKSRNGKTKYMQPREWARPVREQMLDQVAQAVITAVEQTLDKELSR